MLNLPKLIFKFPIWWYKERSLWFLRLFKNLALFLNRQLAITLMVRLWLTPLFGDPNLVGHLIAVVFRTGRILFGLLVILLAEVLNAFLLLIWVFLPFLVFTDWRIYSFIFIGLVFLVYLRDRFDEPERTILGPGNLNENPELFLRSSMIKLISSSRDNLELLGKICRRRVPQRLLQKLSYQTCDDFLKDFRGPDGTRLTKIQSLGRDALLKDSLYQALDLGHRHISSVHLLLSLLKASNYRFADAREVLIWSNREYRRSHPPHFWDENYKVDGLGGFNRGWTGRVTYNLDRYSRDLTREAEAGYLPPLIGKKNQVEEALRVLERSLKNCVLLIGEPGCGKTTLVYGLAQEIVKGTAARGLADKRLMMLEISRISAGTRSVGEVQERINNVLDDIQNSGNIILFLDEIQNAVSAGGSADTSVVFGSLEPRIGQKGFQVIGAATWENYRKYIEPNSAFARLFEKVEIPEAGFDETLEILEYLGLDLEEENKVIITLDCLKACIDLSSRYIYGRVLPDKAVDLLEETVSFVRSQNRSLPLVLKADVQKIVAEKTSIPVTLAVGNTEEAASLLNLEGKIHERLVDQTEAVLALSDAIRRARVGLREEKRPITSLLFVGPTGVGKTETAKALAEVFYGHEERLIRFDMTEYQTEGSVDSLIAKLTDGVRHHPFSLVLLDEAEKANSRILDIFLQVIDDGRLTDEGGKTASFANTILVFTSNAGTQFIYENLRVGRSIDEFKGELSQKLESSFRIELLNRFDGIIVYKPLLPKHTEMIARLKLKKIAADLLKEGFVVSFSEELVKKLAADGYDVALGARPMRRLIQDKVESSIAKKILSGEIKKEIPFSVDISVLL
ncbi:MAG: ATP-dependent Clp protease ATP-binding subunit [Patescibacteria group bacterium]|nr:ATP-dependent Clp protease ATP-binding subunit [Patescibacteria group bacterium]